MSGTGKRGKAPSESSLPPPPLLPFAAAGSVLLCSELLLHTALQATKVERGLELLSVRDELREWVEAGAQVLLGQGLLLAFLFGAVGGVLAHFLTWLAGIPVSGSWRGCLRALLLMVPLWLTYQLEVVLRHPGIYPFSEPYLWWATHAPPWSATACLVAAACAVGILRRLSGRPRTRPAPAPWTLGLLVAGLLLFEGRPLSPDPSLSLPPAAPSEVSPRHIVVISVDALRPDRLSAMGYDGIETPHIDHFLDEAQVFTSAWTGVARTGPSWMSLFTGSDPWNHGFLYDLPDPVLGLPHLPTLPQRLQEEGWRTTWFCDDSRFFPVDPAWGFDEVVQPPPSLANFALGGQGVGIPLLSIALSSRLARVVAPGLAENAAFSRSHRPEAFVRRIKRHLERAQQSGERSFTAIHLTGLHAPSDRRFPFTRHDGVLDTGTVRRSRYARRAVVLSPEEAPAGAVGWPHVGRSLSERARARAASDAAIYDAGIVDLDRQVGALLSALSSAPDLAETLIILWSDHGEALGRDWLNYNYVGPNHGFHGWTAEGERILLAVYGAGWVPAVRRELVTPAELGQTLAIAAGVSLGTDARGDLRQPRRSWVEGATGITQQRYLPPGAAPLPFRSLGELYDARGPEGPPFVRGSFHETLVTSGARWSQDQDVRVVSWPDASGSEGLFAYEIGQDLHPAVVLDATDERVRELLDKVGESAGIPQVRLRNSE